MRNDRTFSSVMRDKNITTGAEFALFDGKDAAFKIDSGMRDEKQKSHVTDVRRRTETLSKLDRDSEYSKGLFTWREGAPANRATRLEGLKHSPPLHATHLTGTVSELRELSLERPLSTTNITAAQGNFFPSYFSSLHGHGPVL